ncbi:MAG: hypothetical protein SOR91_10010 [Hornefia butyriciproducens]|uniref:hypothetical protein n=1 Tax=Hornefia butyriciproducens TaxID=2652293 RepID=UPI002A758928|nr:hypothetical protein [Hornefia butyriciproducens]MCI7327113.1 hypothetical protein [Clostridiales bacterium]MDY2991790.1 hypothetical protein [Hornefia butyriciproducens]
MAFTNREVEHPGRYKLTNASTGAELGTFDLTREEGAVITEGTPLNADNLNNEIQTQAAVIAEVKASAAEAAAVAQIPAIRRGTTSLTVDKKKTGTVTIKYGTTFPGNPHVVLTPLTGSPSVIRGTVKTRTTTSFTAAIYNGTSKKVKIWFSWIAIY